MVCNQPTRSTQPCIPPGSLHRVPALAGGKGWNVTSAGWQVTLCDSLWHVSSSSGAATSVSELLSVLLLLYPCARIVDTGVKSPVYTIQPVVEPVVQPV